MTAGFSEKLFAERTGLTVDELVLRSAGAREKGLLVRGADGWWTPTETGSRFLNDLQAEFLETG